MKNRNGHTLIEALVAIALISSVMMTVAASMSGMYRANRRIRGEIAVERELQRLATQLRSDAHAAQSVGQEETDSTNSIVFVVGGEETLRYSLGNSGVQREHLRGESVLHRDRFRLPETHTARLVIEGDGSATVVSLRLVPRSGSADGAVATCPIQVDAAVGVLASASAATES